MQENEAVQISQHAKNFAPCEIFVGCEICDFWPFDFRLTQFFFLPFYPSCIMGIEGIFFIFAYLSTI